MSFLYGDPDELDQLAQQLRARAAAVRQAADQLVQRAQTAHWVSVAAHAYRDQLARKQTEADRAAEGLEDAAAALQAHAQAVRELLASIARIEQDVTEWFSRKAHEVANVVGSPAAQSLDRSTDPSVQAYKNSASMFFAPEGTPITSRVYQITRG